ncbi:ParB N-terminal domain-containing protein [Mesoterricola sediminis]|uniref:ParB-like N-terminal domain-containing protein n=1 Tax=Mesoterricola sediminis TaxID=2927980 RepID=A0AA48GRI1_9BACT|nr:ParB N-terminal domain-containing protein [Mesoterricola sediminis]BDU76269.1 hypothetical protein METESE_12270 [Mesoterricola sediminis]
MSVCQILLKHIRLDGGTQARAAVDRAAIEEYAALWKDGARFPPIVVFQDQDIYWLADGFHRHAAADKAGLKKIPAEVRVGTLRDARLYAIGANTAHGVRRTNADKRLAVSMLLDDPEWSKWSNRQISEITGVSHHFVNNMRNERVATVATQSFGSQPPDAPEHPPVPAPEPTPAPAPGQAQEPAQPAPAPEPPDEEDCPPVDMTARPAPAPPPADERPRVAQLERLLQERDAEIKDLREHLGETADMLAEAQKEIERCHGILNADDRMAACEASTRTNSELARVIQVRNNGLMVENAQVIGFVKFWRRNFDSLMARVRKALETKEGDDLRAAIQDALSRDARKIEAKKKATTEEEEYNLLFGEAS